MVLKDLLKNKLTKKQLELVPNSFDIIGNRDKAVVIIEIPDKLKSKEKIIANALMKQHKNVKAVLNKTAPRSGVYRTYKLRKIKGGSTEVIHTESGCRFLLDPRKVYFSQRESNERIRISEKVKKETVMVFFAGVGPFAILIAKKAKKVIGIEINPDAIKYFRKNIELNKLNNVSAVLGDVKKKASEYYGKCDRVLMPLPETSDKYIREAVRCLKKGVIHFYCFSKEDKISKQKTKIRAKARQLKKRIKFIGINKVLPYGPGIWKYRIDIEVK